MKITSTFTLLFCIALLSSAHCAADTEALPYRASLSTTLNGNGVFENTPSRFAPTGDFSLEVRATIPSSSNSVLVIKASNTSCMGFEIRIGAASVTCAGVVVSRSTNDDGKAHKYRIAMSAKRQLVYVYRDATLLGTAASVVYGSVVYPTIYDDADNETAKTGIYSEENLIGNPGFETADITYDPAVTKSSDTMFWPAQWNVYNGNDKSQQWNVGVRCYRNKEAYATGREGTAALMFRQDGGGGFTQGSAVYQQLAQTLQPNRKYRAAFRGISHVNATGFSFAVGIGSAAGTWDVMYRTWTAPTAASTAQDYSFDFTTPTNLGTANYFAFIGAGTKGIVHLDRVTLAEAQGYYNSCSLTTEGSTSDIEVGTTTYDAAAVGTKPNLSNDIIDGGDYLLYHTGYGKVLGSSKDGSAPKISAWGANDSVSYVFTAMESADAVGAFYLVQKSTGRYLTASTGNTYSMTFGTDKGASNSSLWYLTPGVDGNIRSVYGGKYIGCDAGSSDAYVSIFYDKDTSQMARWQIVDANYPLATGRLALYTATLKADIASAEALYANPAYGQEADKQELAQALYNGRSAVESASLDNLTLIETARLALEAAIANVQKGNYVIWLSGNSFATGNAFTVAMNGTEMSAAAGANFQLVLRNSSLTGAIVNIGQGYVKIGETTVNAALGNATGRHDYRFAFDGSMVTCYYDGQKIGSAIQYAVPTTTSCGTSAEWTILGIKALTAYNPELVSDTRAVAPGTAVTDEYGKTVRTSLLMKGQTLTLDSPVDMHLLAGSGVLTESKINLADRDAWLVFDNVRPSDVISSYLPNITINGTAATNGTNCRVAIYLQGAVVIPVSSADKPFTGYSGELFAGTAYPLGTGNATLGTAANMIQSFILRRGYMVCLATNADGSGYSRIYVADHADKRIDVLPDLLKQRISYIRVRPWNYVSKKGWCTTDAQSSTNTEANLMGTTWFYSWSADRVTQTDMEYVPQKPHLYWPSWDDINGKSNSTCVIGFNEPEHSEQHTSAKCSCGGTISSWTACTKEPEFMASGLRIGSPSPTDASYLKEFIGHCNDMAYRCDFVTFHAYWGTNEAANAASWKSQLQSIYDNTKRPIWLTEWNNGASWTTETWPSSYSDKMAQQRTAIKNILEVLDNCDFIERYAIYNWDSYYRAVLSWDSNKNSWWVTPAGEIYRDDHPTFAYKESMQFTPVGWLPGFKTDISLGAKVTTSRYITFNITNPNGDFTATQTIEYALPDGSYATLYDEQERVYFDNTSAYAHTMGLDKLTSTEPFKNSTITLRMKVTSLKGDVAYSEPVSVAVPYEVQVYYNPELTVNSTKATGLECKAGHGCLTITSPTARNVSIYDLNGRLVRQTAISAGTTTLSGLPRGVYMLENKKISIY
jgi:hypothetical protein